jgi:hypothetical protein
VKAASRSIARTELGGARPRTAMVRPLERGELTAAELDRIAQEQGAR